VPDCHLGGRALPRAGPARARTLARAAGSRKRARAQGRQGAPAACPRGGRWRSDPSSHGGPVDPSEVPGGGRPRPLLRRRGCPVRGALRLLHHVPGGAPSAALLAVPLRCGRSVPALRVSACGPVASWAGFSATRQGSGRPGAPTARLYPSLVGAFAMPVGLLLYGGRRGLPAPHAGSSAQAASPGGALAGILIGHTLYWLCTRWCMVRVFSHTSLVKAAGVCVLLYKSRYSTLFVQHRNRLRLQRRLQPRCRWRSLSLQAPSQLPYPSRSVPGLGGLFSIVAGINFIVISIATADFALRWRKETSKDVPSKEEPLDDAGVVLLLSLRNARASSSSYSCVRFNTAVSPFSSVPHPMNSKKFSTGAWVNRVYFRRFT